MFIPKDLCAVPVSSCLLIASTGLEVDHENPNRFLLPLWCRLTVHLFDEHVCFKACWAAERERWLHRLTAVGVKVREDLHYLLPAERDNMDEPKAESAHRCWEL